MVETGERDIWGIGGQAVRSVTRAVVVTVWTIVPALGVWMWFGTAHPPRHDLSDISTGLLQLILSAVVALAGFGTALLVTRRRDGA